MNKIILCLFAIILLSSCTTSYQSQIHQGLVGPLGHSEAQFGPNIFRVSFRGFYNHLDDLEKAEDFVLRRCAELALANNFPYFSVQDTSQLSNSTGIVHMRKTIVLLKTEPKPQYSIVHDAEFIHKKMTAKYASEQ